MRKGKADVHVPPPPSPPQVSQPDPPPWEGIRHRIVEIEYRARVATMNEDGKTTRRDWTSGVILEEADIPKVILDQLASLGLKPTD